jgi:single-strand DNA-binding protein
MPSPYVTIIGGATADPEIRFTQAGKAMCRLRVAVRGRKKDAGGDWTDGEPFYYGVVAFGKIAEHIAESVLRGTEVIVQGRLETNLWTDKEGVEHRDLQMVAEDFGLSLRWDSYRKNERTEKPAQPEAGTWGNAEPTDAPPF